MDMAIDGAAAPSLASLLHQSRSLAAQQGRSDLPAIQLGLEQIEAQSRRLVARAAPGAPPPGAHEKAHYFLAGAGVDASQLGADVRRVELRGAFEMLEAVGDTDVEVRRRCAHLCWPCHSLAASPSCATRTSISSSPPSRRAAGKRSPTSTRAWRAAWRTTGRSSALASSRSSASTPARVPSR
jgi:hypothetical protein